MKADTLRAFTTLHTWTGLVTGLALFIAFYAGALTVFHGALHSWEQPATRAEAVQGPDRVHTGIYCGSLRRIDPEYVTCVCL